MKKILFIRSSSNPARILNEAKSLSKEGYLVNILCWDRNSNHSRKEIIEGININYFGFKAPYGKLSLILYLFVWWAYEFYFLLTRDYNIYHVCCFDTIIPAIFAKTLKRNILVYDIFDFYAETFPISFPKIIVNFISTSERFCIRFTDAVIIVDKSRFIQIKGAKIKKLIEIMNCPINITFNISDFRDEPFVVFYGGTLLKTNGLLKLINSIKHVSDVRLVLAGIGPDEKIIQGLTQNVDNASFLGWINYDEYIRQMLKASAVFSFYDPVIPNNRFANSNKVFEAMMCAKPVIVNKETSLASIIINNNCGIVVPYNDDLALANAICYLQQNPDICKKMGANGRKAFEKEYNWDIMEKRLLSIYSEL
jgi:glycosyltransferase involved in cell wall biosynthesis